MNNSSSENERNIKMLSSLVLAVLLATLQFVRIKKDNPIPEKDRYRASIKNIFSIQDTIDYSNMNLMEFINFADDSNEEHEKLV